MGEVDHRNPIRSSTSMRCHRVVNCSCVPLSALGSVNDKARTEGHAGYAKPHHAGIIMCQSCRCCCHIHLCYIEQEQPDGQEYLVQSYRKSSLLPLLGKGHVSVLPAQMNVENNVSLRAKPSVDVNQQSLSDLYLYLSRVCLQVVNLIYCQQQETI